MTGYYTVVILCLIVSMALFEVVTLTIDVDKEIEKDNRAVGFISFTISVGLSFVIGANIA